VPRLAVFTVYSSGNGTGECNMRREFGTSLCAVPIMSNVRCRSSPIAYPELCTAVRAKITHSTKTLYTVHYSLVARYFAVLHNLVKR